jgi:hypothetical protein
VVVGPTLQVSPEEFEDIVTVMEALAGEGVCVRYKQAESGGTNIADHQGRG